MRTERSRTESIVGRAPELEALLQSVSDGTRLVLLSGDAGVGKTRLLSEALDRLAEQGWEVLVGHCLDFGDSAMPYLPFAEMLGEVGHAASDLAESPAARNAVLSRLRHQVPVGGADLGAERLDRAEVFEAMFALVEELSASTPVVMVVEDAHWADASTRDLISFLLSRRFRGRFLCIVTFRSDEMHRRHPLRQRVAEWVRLPGVERLQLDPLPAGAVRGMVEQLIGTADAAYDEDIERIVQRAQGNAFYVEELLSALMGGGGSLPEDLAELLLVRLDRLGDAGREVVRVASAAGQRVSHDLLARVVPVSEERFELGLRDAIDANVLVRTGQQSYAFRHALLGEAVYDDLLPGERMRLHTAYAAAVRELHGQAGAASLARHALASHDLPTALRASIDAGDQALSSGGPDEAARHFTRALEIYDRAVTQLDDPPDEIGLVASTVDALCGAGRPETALALVDSHLAGLTAGAEAVSRARLLLARAEALRSTEADIRPSLGMHAQALVRDDSFDEARIFADQALELADRLDIPRLAAEVGLTLTWLSQHIDFGEGSRAELKRIIEDARVRGDVLSELRALLRAGGLEYDYGALAAAQGFFLEAARLAREIGRPWTIQGISGRTNAGVMAQMRGEWEAALRIADFSAEDPPPTPRAMLEAVTLSVAAGRGDVSALDRLPAIRERWHREGMIAVVGGAATMELLSIRDGAAAAVAMYDDLCAVLTPLWTRAFGARLRLATLALAALADHAPNTATGHRDEVRATTARLVADAEAVIADRVDIDRPFGLEGRAWEARMRAEQLRLEWLLGVPVDLHDLIERWRLTTGLFGELGHVHEQARARGRLAVVLRAAGDVHQAHQEEALARPVAVRLLAVPLLEQLGKTRAPGPDGGALTPREREILALVAQGRGNAEIGKHLFISGKTVSVHVSNVMAKLGAASRTEAVALARRAGLAE